MFRIFLILFLTFISVGCKKSAKQRLDLLLEKNDYIQVSILCEKEKLELSERTLECGEALTKTRLEIDEIVLRPLQMGISSVLVPKAKAEQIEELLRLNTKLGIRYIEIWKQTVIYE